jgi:release factor glutamine methyltransferase
MTVGAALREALVRLANASPTPQLDAALLTAHALGIERTKLLSSRDEPIEDEAAIQLDALIIQRELGVPVAYLLGTAGFYGREFDVTPAVLVPRPETELLVEAAVAFLRALDTARRRVWDVGTGSGAIAITIALDVPEAAVVASEISDEALRIARRNAEKLAAGARIDFRNADLTNGFERDAVFDCIIANLPYIPTGDVPEAPDPAGYEPFIALDGGVDGLELYRRLFASVAPLAAPDALILAEAAPGTIAPLADLARTHFPNAHTTIHRDHAGLERFVRVEMMGST